LSTTQPGDEALDDGRAPEVVDLDALLLGLSPRHIACSPTHVRNLAEVLDALPPILVHRQTMHVIDGVHRVEAHRRAGRQAIRTFYFDGSAAEARVLAIEANVRHGLPLTLSERHAAAKAVLADFADRSDRWIGSICGLAHSTVGALRSEQPGSDTPIRIGIDGRRRRVGRRAPRKDDDAADVTHLVRPVHDAAPASEAPSGAAPFGVDDPALADVADWLVTTMISEATWQSQIEAVPTGRIYEVADECRRRAREWATMAAALEQRGRSSPRRS
jgi:ParB-like chromosome segregation protein Spo0J